MEGSGFAYQSLCKRCLAILLIFLEESLIFPFRKLKQQLAKSLCLLFNYVFFMEKERSYRLFLYFCTRIVYLLQRDTHESASEPFDFVKMFP